jgi:DNA-binding transcriptional LysR family regulator
MNGILEMTKCMNQNVDERILNGMSAFAAIIQCGSFAGAGKALNMSQSGVSRSVARLEARLGMRLLERTTRSISITDEGRRFTDEGRRLHEQIGPLLTGIGYGRGSTSARSTARANASHVLHISWKEHGSGRFLKATQNSN